MTHGNPDTPAPRKLLYVHMAALGDAIMSSAALRLLRGGLPGWEIHVLARSHVQGYFQRLPTVDTVVPFVAEKHVDRRRPWKLAGGADEVLRLLGRLGGEHYDAVVQWRGQLPDTLLSAWTRAPHRVAAVQSIHRKGFLPVEKVPFLVTDLVSVSGPHTHLVEAMAAPVRFLVRKLGGRLPDRPDLTLDYPLRPADHAEARAFMDASGLAETDSFAIVCISARSQLSVWSEERFARVADHVQQRHGLRVVLTGLPEHRDRENAVAGAMRTLPVRAVGRISFGAECALLARSRLLVSLNTGIMHVAAALGVPVVVVNGRDGACHAPWRVPHRMVTRNPFYPQRHPDPRQWGRLVSLVPASEVEAAIDDLLREIRCETADAHA